MGKSMENPIILMKIWMGKDGETSNKKLAMLVGKDERKIGSRMEAIISLEDHAAMFLVSGVSAI